jgi:prophage regulatory protein
MRKPPSDQGGLPRILSAKQVRAMLGVSRTTLWRMIKASRFPRPTLISPQRLGWLEADVRAWIDRLFGIDE